jgi:hypothetical protein
MNILDQTVWSTIKPFLELKVNRIVLFLSLVLILIPITWSFKEMKDLWNVINYIFIIPYTFTIGKHLITRLNSSFFTSIENINPETINQIDIQKIKLVTILNHKFVIYGLLIISVIFQLNYIVSDLGIFTHNSNFYKWNLIYDANFHLSIISKEVFFIYYLLVQFLLLIFSLICILGLIQYVSILNYVFHDDKIQLTNPLPNPPYQGLDEFHDIIINFLNLILIVLANSFTYLINMRAVMPLNLIAFWGVMFMVFLVLIYIKRTLDKYLKYEKKKLTKQLIEIKTNSLAYMQFSENLMNVKTQIFTIKSQIIILIGIFLSILQIILVFVKPDLIKNIHQIFEQEVLPWF